MPETAAAVVQLTILTGDQAGRTIELDGRELTVGRASETDVTLQDANVSRRHASLRPLGDGTAELHDLGSANGTFVNGERVERAVLRGGEQLQFGDTVLRVQGGVGGDTVATQHKPVRSAAEARPTDSAVVRALRNSSVLRTLREDSAIQRLVIAPELKRTRYMTFAALGVALLAVLAVAGIALLGGGSSVHDAVAKVEPSTVLVVPERGGQPFGNGSGWVYDAQRGLIVTNAHVVNDGETFKVGVGNKLVPARVLGVAPCDDLAVLKVAQTAGLQTIELGSQSALALGDTVVAVGYPQSASASSNLTSTAGVVSVVKTTYSDDQALDIPNYPNVVQTDAAINPGNSGGPLVDLNGRLVGVNSAGRNTSQDGRTIQGQSFAIGVDRVKQVVSKLASGHSAQWIGANFRYPSQQQLVAQRLPTGIYLDGAVAGSAAAKAGLGAGSALLTAVNGQPTQNTLQGWCSATRGIRAGQTGTLEVIPAGARRPQRVRVRFG
jgi:S1-C subfamily serine protease